MRRRILLVTAFAPAAAGRHGGGRAVHGLATQLVARHDVVLLHVARDAVDPAIAERCVTVHAVGAPDPGRWGVRVRGATGLARGHSLKASSLPALRGRVAELAREFRPGVVQVESGALGDALAGAGSEALRVITLYEPAASLRDNLGLRPELVHRVDARVALREERRILARADAAVVFTERDRRVVAQTARPRGELVTIALGWDVPARACDAAGADPPTLLFVGNFAHPPNVDAALALARRIFPLVRAEQPRARLQVVGASPPAELRALASDAIDVTGEVDSVLAYLERAAVVVAPIALGGGMRVKLIEALAAGKAVVASSRAAEGIGALAGEELLIADGDAPTAAAAGSLLADAAARRALATRARAWALRELGWERMADRYDELYDRLDAAARRPGGRQPG